MPTYKIRYETWNKYQNHVGESFFSFLVVPCGGDKQQLIKFKVENSLKEHSFFIKNHFGFNQLMIHSLKEFNELHLLMECEVKVLKINPFEFKGLSLPQENEILNSYEFKIDNHLFLVDTHYTDVHPDQISKEWRKTENETVFDFLLRINQKIHAEFEFKPDDTSLSQNAYSTMEKKKGVCQDFAHLFLGIVRANNIPGRYVSGYLNQGDEFTGSILMHAWIESLIPGVGWVGFDPTNNLVRDNHYIKVCHGTDYDDCSPIKGVLKTEGENETQYKVEVIQQ